MREDLSDLDIASVESNSNAAQNDVCEELRIEKDDSEIFRRGLPANGPKPETRIFAVLDLTITSSFFAGLREYAQALQVSQ